MNEKIIIFGIGVSGRAIYRQLPSENIVGFIDNNEDLDGTQYDNKPIYSLSKLNSIDYDKIALGGVWIQSMLDQLKSLSVPENKILQINDCDVDFSTNSRNENTDMIIDSIYKICKKESINCYVIGSSLVTLFRNKNLSSVADVDLFLTSQNDANLLLETVNQSDEFLSYEVINVTYQENEILSKKNEIKKIIIKSKTSLALEEPAIVDVSIANFLDGKYMVRHGDNYIYIPKFLCEGERYFSYKNMKLQIPKFAEDYLSLLYGENWIIPPKKWDQSDYGNLLTANEVKKLKDK